MCPPCLAALPRLLGSACARCGRPTVRPVSDCGECRGRRLAYASAAAALSYEGSGAALVRLLKSGRARALADPAAELVAALVPAPDAGVVAWVPPDPWRLVLRGAHAPELLAVRLGAAWGLPAARLLECARRHRSQRALGTAQRQANVRDAFRVRRGARVPAEVVLVDDVYTTGATVDAAARALRRGGAAGVRVVTLARAVRL